MYCPRCGAQNQDQAIACYQCGQGMQPEAQPYGAPPTPPIPQGQFSGKAIASLVLGIISLLAWCLPILGLPVSLVGLVLGIKALPSGSRGMAIAGVVMCAIGLVLGVLNAAYGAYLGATGQHPLIPH